LEWCDDIGLRCKLSFIVGLPGETRETVEEPRGFLRKHLIHAQRKVHHKVDLCSFIPAGTPIYKAVMRREGDGLDASEDFDIYGYHPGESTGDFDLRCCFP
jgi:radical SAM superfamily enzyme YgiQ (UPF0313 family)